MRYRAPPRPSKRRVANEMEWLSGGTNIKQSVKRGPQKESKVNLAGQEWAPLRGGELYRNRRGLAQYLPPHTPVGIGPNGTGDLIGPFSIVITSAMVGKRIAAYAELESKTEDGVVAKHQEARINYLLDIGALAGVARDVQEFDAAYNRWMMRLIGAVDG